MPGVSRFLLCIVISLAIVAASATSCKQEFDCGHFQVCGSDSQCRTRSLWLDYRWEDAVGFVIIFLGAVLAAGGGIGGGGVFIPLLTMVIGMDAKQAIPISQATIFGGSIVNLLFNIRGTHPKRPRCPLIDYSAVMMFTPMLLAGTTIGVVLNVVFPSWLVTFLLVIIMSYISRRTFKKAMSTWQQETQAELERERSSMAPLEPLERLSSYSSDNESEPEPAEIRYDIAMIVVMWLFVVVFNVLKGSKPGGLSLAGVRSCSTTYWFLNAGLLVSLTFLTWVLGRHMSRRTEAKYSVDNDDNCDIRWDSRSTILYPALSVVAGIVGGLLGIGGGMILAPLLLELGMHSRVVSATSATAVLITASSAVVQYLLLDMLIPSYSIILFLLGVIATAVGQLLFDYLVRKYKRTSLLSLSIAAMIIAATILLFISGVLGTIRDFKHGHMGFSLPC